MKEYRVRYHIDIVVEAESKDEAYELAGREIENVKPCEFDADEARLVQNRVKRKYHFSKDELALFEEKASKLDGEVMYDHGLAYVDFCKPNARAHANIFGKWAIKKGYRVHKIERCDGVYEVFWRVLLVAPDIEMCD